MLIAWIPLLPLLGFLINGLWYAFFQAGQNKTKASAPIVGSIATLAIAAAFVVSCVTFLRLQGMDASQRVIEENLFSWIDVANLQLPLVLRVDVLNSLFLMVITGIGTLIHLYSIGYMSHDATPGKFFAYLNLFCFSMLMLVLGGSLPILFLGWKGVGLCSYLLIGYWYTDIEKAAAGKKAFIVNRVGDFGFLIGMFLIFTTFGTLDFVKLREVFFATGAAAIAPEILTAIGLLLFVGCMGKSAQIPLYVWLPDAMAGPTPVSALIHAATMVTSGIYMVARLNFLYSASNDALMVVAVVGGVTAFFAATIAIVQTDIKKVLAYSTVSQLGYMFLACGVGAYATGVFHVITHAFFKALLFLGAGSVIHGMHEEQNILKMGGLKKDMKWTYLTFAAGWLAICGMPPFSGFFSKDEILWRAFSSPNGSMALWALGSLTAIMTAFYMTRLFVLTFLGTSRSKGHAHESSPTMLVPLQVLAVLSIFGGFLSVPHMSWLEHWLLPVIPEATVAPGVSHDLEWVLMALSVAGGLVGIFAATRLYRDLKAADALKQKWAGIHGVLTHKWYIDEVYDALLVKPIYRLSQFLWKQFDVAVIDRIVLSFGKGSLWSGRMLRPIQSGSVQIYLVLLVCGAVLTAGYLLYGLG